MEIFKAINALQEELSKVGISKDKNAGSGKFSYKFRGIDDVYNTLSPMLARHGIVVIPRFSEREVTQKQGQNGILFYVSIKGEFDFISSKDGSKVSAITYGEAMDSGDKATNKAMSIAYKYACFQVFAIPTEGDNDPDAHIHQNVQDVQSKFISDGLFRNIIQSVTSGVHVQTGAPYEKKDAYESIEKHGWLLTEQQRRELEQC